MAMSNQTPVVHRDPEILGGTPVFVGTRVPVKSLYDYLEARDSLDEFRESFPSVSREQAVAALELAHDDRARQWAAKPQLGFPGEVEECLPTPLQALVQYGTSPSLTR
jgi:uncharacterized protein (DUF433 family)